MGKKTPHFKNGIFHNQKQLRCNTLWDLVSIRFSKNWAKWPQWIEIPLQKKPIPRVEGSQIRVTFINHSTFLIQTGGYNILTDPIYSHRCSPVPFVGPARVHKPSIPFEYLPKIDMVLISHDHYDHLDLNTISRLTSRDNPKIYMGLEVSKHLRARNNVTELDWWESACIDKNFNLAFTKVQHLSGRSITDQFSTLWGGFVLEINHKKIYFGGDSGYADHYQETFEQFGPMDLSFLPIGAYAPRNNMANAHMDPCQAIQAHIDLRSQQSIGMHYGTFQLTEEKREEPQLLLEEEKKKASISTEEFITLKLGKPFLIP